MAKRKATKKAPRSKKTAGVEPARLFDYLELKSVRLLASESTLSIVDGTLPKEYQIEMTTGGGPARDGSAVHVDVGVRVKTPGTENASSSVLIAATFQCVYAIRGADIEGIRPHIHAIAANGTLVAWPHLREFVQSVTLRMCIPPFSLPLITIGPQGPVFPSFAPAGD